MILKTPHQYKIVENDNYPSIRTSFSEFECTFVILHPFLKINEGSDIKFETGKWPSKREIIENTTRINWIEIIEMAKLINIQELDDLLAYLHCARWTADKTNWIKFKKVVDKNNLSFAQVDFYPAILIDVTLELIKNLGYNNIFLYSDSEERKSFKVQDLIESDFDFKFLGGCPRILTPDNKILFETNYDARFTYLSSDKKSLEMIIMKLNLEGFYCNPNTKSEWSYKIQKENLIDWKSPERNKNYAQIM